MNKKLVYLMYGAYDGKRVRVILHYPKFCDESLRKLLAFCRETHSEVDTTLLMPLHTNDGGEWTTRIKLEGDSHAVCELLYERYIWLTWMRIYINHTQ